MGWFAAIVMRSMASGRVGASRPGQATVEFMLASLIILPLLFGIFEVGRGVWFYNQLSHLSRESGRWMIVTAADNQTLYTLAGNTPGTYTVGSCSCNADTAVGWIARQDVGIPTSDMTVVITRPDIASGAYTWGMEMTVSVRYSYRPILTNMLNIPVTIPLRADAAMRMQ